MNSQLKFLTDFDLKDKQVFMRVDFNVPIKNGKVLDAYRIEKSLPSLQYALEEGAKVVLASHLGRPKGQVIEALSLQPIAIYLTQKHQLDIIFLEEPDSDAPHYLLPKLKRNQVILLNNLRFHKGEQEADNHLVHQWASYTDIYVNEGFSISHRKDSSVYLLPTKIDHCCVGFQFQKEMQALDRIRSKTAPSPFFVLIGGSKIEDKFLILEQLIDQTDEFFIGGLMAYSFLKAQGQSVGSSCVYTQGLRKFQEFMDRLEQRGKKIWLPIDHIVCKGDDIKVTQGASIPDNYKGVDIGPQTQKLFAQELKRAASIFWNGPMGYFENDRYSKGTRQLAKVLSEYTNTYRVIGGGHSALAAREYEEHIDHISTGGGASLCYLKGEALPGLQSVLVNVK